MLIDSDSIKNNKFSSINLMPKGFIKSWRRDRGFGFINVDGQDDDVFVHISELRDLGRPPRIGDEISFSIETQDNGKNRAINCKVKGSNKQSNGNNPNQTIEASKNKTTLTIGIVLAIVALGLGVYFFLIK